MITDCGTRGRDWGDGRACLQESYQRSFDIRNLVADSLIMIRRYFCILIAVWAFWGMPTLCVAGMLKHTCAPEQNCSPKDQPCDEGHDSHDSDHSHESDLPHDEQNPLHSEGCNHESGCVSDPCSTSVTRPDRDRDTVAALPLCPVALPSIVIDDSCLANCRHSRSTKCIEPLNELPLYQSDLPLII